MELSFASAGWLAGMSALLLPILLHWLASQQQPPSRFAPMRFLQNLAAEQRGRRLSDLWLLLVRMLLLALVVAALAEPDLQMLVARTRAVTVLHPTVTSDSENADHYRLCAGPELLPAAQTCPATVEMLSPTAPDTFLTDLLQIIDQHPDWQVLTVRAPAALPLAPLALLTVPVDVIWQLEPASSAATSESTPIAPWRVFASDDDWRLFAAGNAVGSLPRWQRTEQVGDAEVVVTSGSEATQPTARVWWHERAVAWQRAEGQPTRWDYHLAGPQLQLRWSANDADLAVALLAQTENWLQRGHWQPPINPATLRFSGDSTLVATRHLDLAPWLMLAALLCWLLERRLAHGRR